MFTLDRVTPISQNKFLLIERLHKIFPIIHSHSVIFPCFQSLFIHILMDFWQESGHFFAQIVPFYCKLIWFFSFMSDGYSYLFCCEVLGTNLNSHGCTFELPFIKFPTRLLVAFINCNSQTSFLELIRNLICFTANLSSVVLRIDRDDYELCLCYIRRQDKTFVVRMYHNHSSD